MSLTLSERKKDEFLEKAEELFKREEPRAKPFTYGWDLNDIGFKLAFFHAAGVMTVWSVVISLPFVPYGWKVIFAITFPYAYFSAMGWIVTLLYGALMKPRKAEGKPILHGPLQWIDEVTNEVMYDVAASLVINRMQQIEPKHLVESIARSLAPQLQNIPETGELFKLASQIVNEMLPTAWIRVQDDKGDWTVVQSRYQLWYWEFLDTPVEDPKQPGTVFDRCLMMLHPQHNHPNLAFDEADGVETHFAMYRSKSKALRSLLQFYRRYVPLNLYIGVVGMPRQIRHTWENVRADEPVLQFTETTALMRQQQVVNVAILEQISSEEKTKKAISSRVQHVAGLDSLDNLFGASRVLEWLKQHGGKLTLIILGLIFAAILIYSVIVFLATMSIYSTHSTLQEYGCIHPPPHPPPEDPLP